MPVYFRNDFSGMMDSCLFMFNRILKGREAMKQKVVNLLGMSTFIFACNTAMAVNLLDDMTPFVGIDYQQRWMNGNSDWNKIFPGTYAGGSVYVGGRWDCFAVELGYDFSGTRRRTFTFGPGQNFFNTSFAGATVQTNLQLNGGHIDLIGFVPVVNCLEMMGVIGIGYIYPRLQVNVVGGPFNGTTVSGRGTTVARLRFGGNYMVTPCVGIRLLVGWESTEYLRIRSGPIFTGTGASVRGWKSSVTANAGIFVKF